MKQRNVILTFPTKGARQQARPCFRWWGFSLSSNGQWSKPG